MADLYCEAWFSISWNKFFKSHHYAYPLTRLPTYFINVTVKVQLVAYTDS